MRASDRRTFLRGAATACAAASLGSRVRAGPATLRLGYGGAAEEPFWLLIARPSLGKNYGKAYTLDATRFQGSDKRAQAFEAGAIDLALSGANGVLFAAAEGVSAKIIASISQESSRGFSTTYYAKTQSGIKSVPDLKGKTVGLNGFSTSGHLWLLAALEKHGLSDFDVTITPVPFPAMEEALLAGKIDAGEFPQPFAALLAKDIAVNKVFDAKYGLPFDEELNVLIAKDEFLKRNAVAVRALLEDLHAAMQLYLQEPHEARQMLIDSRMVRVRPDVYLDMQDYYRDPSLRPHLDALRAMQEFQIKAGFQKKSVDVEALLDLSYLPD